MRRGHGYGIKGRVWKCHIQNTLIYNKLWHRIFYGDITSTKITEATWLTKWKLKDDKALALLHCFTIQHLSMYIENLTYVWFSYDEIMKLSNISPTCQQVYL